jgi:hypothetical protein
VSTFASDVCILFMLARSASINKMQTSLAKSRGAAQPR